MSYVTVHVASVDGRQDGVVEMDGTLETWLGRGA